MRSWFYLSMKFRWNRDVCCLCLSLNAESTRFSVKCDPVLWVKKETHNTAEGKLFWVDNLCYVSKSSKSIYLYETRKYLSICMSSVSSYIATRWKRFFVDNLHKSPNSKNKNKK